MYLTYSLKNASTKSLRILQRNTTIYVVTSSNITFYISNWALPKSMPIKEALKYVLSNKKKYLQYIVLKT